MTQMQPQEGGTDRPGAADPVADEPARADDDLGPGDDDLGREDDDDLGQGDDESGRFEPEEEIDPAGPAGHLIAAVVPILLGLFCLVYSLSLSLGTPVNAGPGLWPTVVSVVLVGAGLWALAFERRTHDVERFSRGALQIGVGIVSLVVYVMLIGEVGFEIPTLVLLAFWLKVLGKESWPMTLIISVATTVTFYLLFVTLLGVPLPRLVY